MDETKPCPFCGGKAEIFKPHGQKIDTRTMPYRVALAVICTNTDCGAHMGNWYDRADAITAWNRRPAPEKGRLIDANVLSEEIQRLQIFLAGESLFTPAIKETILRFIDEQPTVGTTPENKPPCYNAEKDNPYPLCVGCGMTACAQCCLWADYEQEVE